MLFLRDHRSASSGDCPVHHAPRPVRGASRQVESPGPHRVELIQAGTPETDQTHRWPVLINIDSMPEMPSSAAARYSANVARAYVHRHRPGVGDSEQFSRAERHGRCSRPHEAQAVQPLLLLAADQLRRGYLHPSCVSSGWNGRPKSRAASKKLVNDLCFVTKLFIIITIMIYNSIRGLGREIIFPVPDNAVSERAVGIRMAAITPACHNLKIVLCCDIPR